MLDWEDLRDRGASALSSSESRRVRLLIDCARLTSSVAVLGGSDLCRLWRKGEFSLGVPEPPTKRDTTSLFLPFCGVPFSVED